MPEHSISPASLMAESNLVGILLSLWSVVVGVLVLVGGVTRMAAPPWQLALAIMPGGTVGWGSILLAVGLIGIGARLWYRYRNHRSLPVAITSYAVGGVCCWAIAICHLIVVIGSPVVGWLGCPLFALIGTLFLLHTVALRRIRTERPTNGP